MKEIEEQFRKVTGVQRPVSKALLYAFTRDEKFAHYLVNSYQNKDLVELILSNKEKEIAGKEALPFSNQELAKRLSKSLARWAGGGFKKLSKVQIEKRRAACAACPYRSTSNEDRLLYKVAKAVVGDNSTCSKCGCMLEGKIKLPEESCPMPHPSIAGLNRWGEKR
jgi:hypothetical protein